jgi:hypothetical protein
MDLDHIDPFEDIEPEDSSLIKAGPPEEIENDLIEEEEIEEELAEVEAATEKLVEALEREVSEWTSVIREEAEAAEADELPERTEAEQEDFERNVLRKKYQTFDDFLAALEADRRQRLDAYERQQGEPETVAPDSPYNRFLPERRMDAQRRKQLEKFRTPDCGKQTRMFVLSPTAPQAQIIADGIAPTEIEKFTIGNAELSRLIERAIGVPDIYPGDGGSLRMKYQIVSDKYEKYTEMVEAIRTSKMAVKMMLGTEHPWANTHGHALWFFRVDSRIHATRSHQHPGMFKIAADYSIEDIHIETEH